MNRPARASAETIFFCRASCYHYNYVDMRQLWLMPKLQEDSGGFIFQQDRAPPYFHVDSTKKNDLGQWPWLVCSFHSSQVATLLEFLLPLTNCFVRRWVLVQNLHCMGTIDLVLANSKTQNTILSPVLAIFHHDHPLAVKSASTQQRLLPKQTWRDSVPIDILLSAVFVLVVALSSSKVPEGHTNCPAFNWF
jgi:hypothetical protein